MCSIALCVFGMVGPARASTTTIRAVELIGNTSLDRKTLQSRLSIKPGSTLDLKQVDFSRNLIESIYRDQGFAEVKVSTDVVHVPVNHVDIRFLIKEGPIYRIHSVQVEGNQVLSDRLIRRDFGVHPGEIFSPTKIFEGNKLLFLSGYFETTDIQYSSTTTHEMDIHIKVKERPTQFLKGGLGYGTQTKERVSLGYEDRNFFGNEKQLDLKAVHSGFLTNPHKYRTTLLETGLAQPHFLNTRFDGQTSISEEWDNREPYDSRTTAWRSSLGRRFGNDITASLRYRFQGTQITRIDPSAADTTASFVNVSAIGPTFTYDNTNDPFLPTIGWRITSLFEKGFTAGIGDINFHRLEARAGRFDTFFRQLTIFLGLQAGLVRPDHSGDSIPIFERYTLGGANTVRGYEEQELGPRDAQGSPLGGNAFLVGNVEIRHILYKKLLGLWFLDSGQLYEQPIGNPWPYIRAKGLGDFAYGTGPGLRLNTPVGAVRLEVGYKLNPSDGDASFFQRTSIHFSLGEVF